MIWLLAILSGLFVGGIVGDYLDRHPVRLDLRRAHGYLAAARTNRERVRS